MVIFAKKSLGQNFLIQPQIVADIVSASEARTGETVIEIGPGTGLLTQKLLEIGANVTAIEKDSSLIPILEQKFQKNIEDGSLTLLNEDILKTLLKINGEYRVVANIPYYITGKIIRLFLEKEHKPISMTILVQKEVAERILAKDQKESLLSISVKAYGDPEYIKTVRAGNFRPVPKVDSAILHIADIDSRNFASFSEEHFFSVLRTGFKSKRKKLFKNLKSFNKEHMLDNAFDTCSIEKGLRAEDLSVKDWVCLSNKLQN